MRTPTVVIGQKNFTSLSSNVDESTLGAVQGVAFDKDGNLWAADQSNNRVLEFKQPFSNGMAASLVLGHSDFTAQAPTSNPTESSLSAPQGLTFDSNGNLWAAGHSQGTGVDLTQPCCVITLPPYSEGRVLEYSSVSVPEFPASSVGVVALASFAGAAIVLRRFYANSSSKGHV